MKLCGFDELEQASVKVKVDYRIGKSFTVEVSYNIKTPETFIKRTILIHLKLLLYVVKALTFK